MSEQAIPHALLSVEDYLRVEREGWRRHEYVGGIMHAHAGGTRRHDLISVNLLTELHAAARGGPCRVHSSDRLLRADDSFYYPDVTVVCPEDDEEADEDSLFEEAPCLVVEVTSPSTEAVDRREKLLAYRRIPSLLAYLIVDQTMMRVERHWRDENGQWWQAEAVGRDGIVRVPCPEVEIPLPRIYEGVRGAP